MPDELFPKRWEKPDWLLELEQTAAWVEAGFPGRVEDFIPRPTLTLIQGGLSARPCTEGGPDVA